MVGSLGDGQPMAIAFNKLVDTHSSVLKVTSGSTMLGGSGPWRRRYASSSALARARATARVSVSCRLRSRELWAAARLRLIRSMRRCSFSSSVLARLRGGRAVVGSGRVWPQDFRFLAGREWTTTGGGMLGESMSSDDGDVDASAAVVWLWRSSSLRKAWALWASGEAISVKAESTMACGEDLS